MQQTSSRRVIRRSLRLVEALESFLLVLALATTVRLEEASVKELCVRDRGFRQTNRLGRVYESKEEDDGEEQENDCTSNHHLGEGVMRERKQVENGHVESRCSTE